MFSRNATNAFVSKMRGLRDGIRQPKTRFVREMEDAPDTHDLIERREPLRERQDSKVDERADGRVVVQRHERVHLQAVQEDLNHDEPRCLKLFAPTPPCQSLITQTPSSAFLTHAQHVRRGGRKGEKTTHGDSGGLGEEADEVEA